MPAPDRAAPASVTPPVGDDLDRPLGRDGGDDEDEDLYDEDLDLDEDEEDFEDEDFFEDEEDEEFSDEEEFEDEDLD
jgi:hypothetical protein